MLQLAKRFGFDLTDPFPRNRELLTDFFQRVVGVHADTKTHAQDTFLTRQACQAELTSGLNDFVRKYMIILFGGVFIVVGGLLLWKPPSNFGDGSAGGGGVGF